MRSWVSRSARRHFVLRDELKSMRQSFRQPITARAASSDKQLDDFLGDLDSLMTEADATLRQQPADRMWMDTLQISEILAASSSKKDSLAMDPSPVEVKQIKGRRVYIKRDDLLRVPGSQLSGNKARKLWSLSQVPASKFPKALVSYGGPQSNAMLALAALVYHKNQQWQTNKRSASQTKDKQLKRQAGDESKEATEETILPEIQFFYFTKKLPRFLREQPNGNLFRAQSLGMKLVELSQTDYRDYFGSDSVGNYASKAPEGIEISTKGQALWVPQGGAFALAYDGAQRLAQEIVDYWLVAGRETESNNDESMLFMRPLSVVLPGGTCSTGVLVHHAIRSLVKTQHELLMATQESSSSSVWEELDIEVVVVPCVGDSSYARRQMQSLSAQIGASTDDIPTVLEPSPLGLQSNQTPIQEKYFSFGEPHKDILSVFQRLQETCNLVVDLIYGAPAWTIMFRHWTTEAAYGPIFDPNNPLAGREIMYVHSGGLEGINSQLLRYKYKGLVSIEDIQLPGKTKR